QGVVGRDAVHPAAEGRLAAELAQVLVGGEEGVLGDLRSVGLAPRHPERESVDLLLVPAHQRLEGGHVPGLRTGHELAVVLDAVGLRHGKHPRLSGGRAEVKRRLGSWGYGDTSAANTGSPFTSLTMIAGFTTSRSGPRVMRPVMPSKSRVRAICSRSAGPPTPPDRRSASIPTRAAS